MPKVKFIHNKSDDYKIYPANGVWGGITPRGDLMCNFFVEQNEVPKETFHDMGEDGTLGQLIQDNKEYVHIERVFQVGILLNREQAVSLANWILKKISQYDKQGDEGKES